MKVSEAIILAATAIVIGVICAAASAFIAGMIWMMIEVIVIIISSIMGIRWYFPLRSVIVLCLFILSSDIFSFPAV